MENTSQILIYQSPNGITKVEVRMEEETVWLTQSQLAELFQTTKQNISLHIQNIFEEKELLAEATVRDYLTVQKEGNREVKRKMQYFNLDVIISVGYRVKSHVATHFRIWATQRLKEYIVKGFTLNDELLKNAGGGNYFEELLARIRDIRSSEKIFWRKVLDIYATSIDYDPNEEISKEFFKTVQNKMHWAAHGNTAAEVIYNRVDAGKPNLGLTNFKGSKPTPQDIEIAKNYLSEEELNILNRMVTAYLEVAELQALNRTPMYMKDWVERLNDFLKMTGNEILPHAGSISHEQAIEKARIEYGKFREINKDQLSRVEEDFIKQIETTAKQLKEKK
ncbi:MAG: virulence RhuM family protein [Ignavibacteriae bacterium]|nr:virulence RhuM family protein [Ignavibacteriota bacterium]